MVDASDRKLEYASRKKRLIDKFVRYLRDRDQRKAVRESVKK